MDGARAPRRRPARCRRQHRTHLRRRPGQDLRKDHGRRRRVPLSSRAQAGLDQIPARLDVPLLFPSPEGHHLDLSNFRARDWRPALEAAGIPHRRIYDLRHTFASHALAAGVPIFELARYMGTSVRMIDRTYGHLVRGSEHAVRDKLDRYAEKRLGHYWATSRERGIDL